MLNAIVDLVLPRHCVGCGSSGSALCGRCGAAAPELLHWLGVPAWAGARYEDGVRAAMLRYKERGRRDLAGPLAGLLVAALDRLALPEGTALVPMPSSASSRKARGYDHLTPLARTAGRRLRRPTAPVLEFGREVADSAGLGVRERDANLAGAMRARPPARPGLRVAVVDDIVTTGASAREACRALQAAGWHVAGFAAAAATPKPPARATEDAQ